MSGLTTHILDQVSGRPAAEVAVRVWLREGDTHLLAEALTDQDGRARLLAGEDLTVGTYELTFAIGGYFAAQGLALADPPFLDEVVIRFGVAELSRHYHVPLLVSPYGYATYRGS